MINTTERVKLTLNGFNLFVVEDTPMALVLHNGVICRVKKYKKVKPKLVGLNEKCQKEI